MYSSERDFVAAYLKGDKTAYSEVQRWIDKVIVRATRGDSDAHKDLTNLIHQVLVVKLKGGEYRGDGILLRYVMSIAKNKTIEMLRSKYRNRIDSGYTPDMPSTDPNPEEQLLQNERLDLLAKALETLGSPCQELLVRILCDGESYSAIVGDFHLTPGSARVKVLRCKEKLREICEKLDYEW